MVSGKQERRVEGLMGRRAFFGGPEHWQAELRELERMAHEGVPHVPSSATVGAFVRILRTQLGWKQEALASFARVSPSTVERVERGEPVSAGSLDRIAVALGQEAGAFTEPRVPLGAEAALAKLEESAKPFENRVAVAMRPLRGHRQVAALARTHLYIVDAARLGEGYEEDAADLREWLDLAAFLLASGEPDSITDLGRREPIRRRRLYEDVLRCARDIERRGRAVALAGTYTTETGRADLPRLDVALVAFFPKPSDPGAAKRRTLFAPARVDLAGAAWPSMDGG